MKILCRYQYDPLDRLMGMGLLEHASTQRFYQADHLTTELGEQTQRTIIRHEAQPLAQQQSTAGVTETTLLATDQTHSLLQTLAQTNPQQLAYTAYGHHPGESGLSRLLGFNGECPDAITGHYLLGQGTRVFNPVLMRFNSPDELSPFGEGGINPYAYCVNDPVNHYDPTGNAPIKQLFRPWNIRPDKTKNIFRPWEELGLDLSSPAITRPDRSASMSPTSIIPAERAPRKSARRTVRTYGRDLSYGISHDKRKIAREYDRILLAKPELKIKLDHDLLSSFKSAKADAKKNLDNLVPKRQHTKQHQKVLMKLQNKRYNVKASLLEKLAEDGHIIRKR